MRISRWVVAVSLTIAAVLAQSDRGTITGTMTDPADAMIPAAAVLLKNAETGAQYETVTTATGNYTLSQLPAGVYELTVTAPGFAKYVQQGIRVQVAQTARVDVAMKVGSAAESVTVTSDAPLLKTEGAEQSYNMEISRMNSLPINFAGRMRNPLTFAWLAPGTSIALTSGELRTAVKVNGLPTSTMSVRIEGQDTTETVNPGTMDRFLPSVEAIQEVVDANQQLRGGVRAGGRRIVQLHHEVRHQPIPRQRVRLLRQRVPECRPAVHRQRPG